MNVRAVGHLFLIAASLLAVGTGCWRPTIRGSGVSKSETRSVGAFTRIRVAGSPDVTARVGSPPSLVVTGDDNLLPYLTTEVRDGALEIAMKGGSFSPKAGVKVEVTVPALEAVDVAGSSNVEVSGLPGGRFEARIAGSGEVRASGQVERLEARIAGSGDMQLDELAAREATVKIAGSGNAEVRVSESLSVSIAGSGDVRYVGDPKVTKSIAGSGNVSRR